MQVSDGVRFHIARSGAGPAVVLLHGFTGSTETWTELQSALDDRFTTLAVDLTGHGKSAVPADPNRYSLSQFAHDIRDILDGLGIARAVLLGYSMGGRAALRFAIANPDRVAGLILESTSPGISEPTERAQRVAADTALAASIERDGISAFVDRWERLPLWSSLANVPEESRVLLRAQRLSNRPLGIANSLRGAGAGAEPAVTELLTTIRTPVLIVAGALDPKYFALGRIMAASFPRARLEVVAGVGHMVHLEQPAQFSKLVMGFLEQLDPRSWQ